MTDVRSILVPLDGSPLSEQALFRAASLAHRFQSEVILLHFPNIHLPPPPTPLQKAEIGWMKAVLACAGRKAERYLDACRQELDLQAIEVRTMVCERTPVDGILAAAYRERPDLIVMSGHGQDELPRWHLGSVAADVARQSPCPVLLVPCVAQGGRE